MPILKRELAFVAASSTANSGDWWHLVLDTDTPGLYVEHSWAHASPHSDGQIARGGSGSGSTTSWLTRRISPLMPPS